MRRKAKDGKKKGKGKRRKEMGRTGNERKAGRVLRKELRRILLQAKG